MPTYGVSYRFPTCFRRLLEDIEADELDAEQDGAWWVLWKSQLVIGQPRRVVRLRISARRRPSRSCPAQPSRRMISATPQAQLMACPTITMARSSRGGIGTAIGRTTV